jgi:hypothetical protein
MDRVIAMQQLGNWDVLNVLVSLSALSLQDFISMLYNES